MSNPPFDPKTIRGMIIHYEVASDGTLVDLMQPDEYAPLKAAVKEALDVGTGRDDPGGEGQG